MKSPIDHIQEWYPKVLDDKVLDVGSGLGRILIEIAQRGGQAYGVETSKEMYEMTKQRAREAGVTIHLENCGGEVLPFKSNEFGFVNLSEVIEHVDDPVKVLSEVYRVLKPGGQCYMSVPTRFGLKDPHFNLYFVNWLPRFMAHRFISIFGKHKDYSPKGIGRERLDEMNYYRYGAIKKLCESIGFRVYDIRIQKINRKFPSAFLKIPATLIYYIARMFYFDSAHVRLIK